MSKHLTSVRIISDCLINIEEELNDYLTIETCELVAHIKEIISISDVIISKDKKSLIATNKNRLVCFKLKEDTWNNILN